MACPALRRHAANHKAKEGCSLNKLQYCILLLSVTALWSSEMILMKHIPEDISPFAVLTMTNGIGSIMLGTVFFGKIRRSAGKKIMLRSLILSVMNISYNTLIMLALRHMDPSSGSFVVSFTLVLIPIALMIMGRKVSLSNLAGMAAITIGIICARNTDLSRNDMTGLMIMLAVCVIRALYIIKSSDFAKDTDPAAFTFWIEASVTILSFVIWFIFQPATFFAVNYSKEMLSSVFMDGYLICGFAAFLNLIALRYASPSTCSAIYSFQIIFAVLLSAYVPDIMGASTDLTPQKALGCLLITAGALCSELGLIEKKRRSTDL